MGEQEEASYEPLFTPTDRPSQQTVYISTSDFARNSQQGTKVDGSQLVRENSLGKQMSLLHQSSSYFKQATSGLMRWQSRRAFWSAVDASGVQPQGVGVACGNTRSSMAFWFKTVCAVSRRHPSVLVAPLLLLCALIAGGIAGVVVAAKNSQQLVRDDTAILARQAAATLELTLDTQALQPAAALASLVREQPSAAVLGGELASLMSRLLQQPTSTGTPTSITTPVRQLVLAPFGTVNATYSPLASATARGPIGSDMFIRGTSILAKDSVGAVALAVRKQLPVAATVVTTAAANGSVIVNGFSEILLVVYHPVYVAGVGEEETWGNSISDDFLKKICADGGCYQASSQTKLWGFTVAIVSLSALVSSPEAGLQSLLEGEYQCRLTVIPSGAADWVNLAASLRPPQARHGTAAVRVRLAGPRSPSLVVSASTEADLILDHDDGWKTSWEGPMIAVTIGVSLALSGFFFAVLFNYWRHWSMLMSMLPEKVIRVLGTGSNYYQHFDCVTVLYADVVRYTTVKQQGDAVPTLEVVKLLNDVHAMYESIIDKYSLVRISRSGESFICVGGCPTPDDPVSVAVKVAACARDLVLATSRFRGAGGFRVQIRLGLHSGPAVAAVVGSKMPRFSLFGDVVDVAYYMEATSRAMAIHVSDQTSQLLKTANDPLLQLTPRGCLDIIGQGSMNSSWLKLDQIPQPLEPHPDDAGEEATARKRGGEGSQAALLTMSPPKP
ncbi:hypothetical protein VaNZ11_017069 [Volvox africanus]|uniref:Guanylate cyclase domain-containing protein n=1 Tax=Volvox africanus TaxID=51714 RepID=A0ABQ5SQF2_9CHLO|nr:hypothetical protein VaNZ11_017069 [Volvox africanus]